MSFNNITYTDLALLGPVFWGSLIIIFAASLFLVGIAFEYARRKKFNQALVVVVGIVALCTFFFVTTRSYLQNRLDGDLSFKQVEAVDPGPPERDYPFIKKHRLARDPSYGTISAVDGDTFKMALRRDNPRQVFQDSFFIMMDKEGRKFKDDKSKLEYARFIILMYYGESAPIFPDSAGSIAARLKSRRDEADRKLGEKIENMLPQIEKKKGKAKLLPPQTEEEWDFEGGAYTFDAPAAANILSRVSKPEILHDYDSSALIRIYTFSLRYSELAEWQFKIYESGEVWVKRMNLVSE